MVQSGVACIWCYTCCLWPWFVA